MKISIVYSSKTGNTLSVAEKIKDTIGCVEYFGNPCNEAADADLIFVGFWTDKGKCSKEIEDFLHTLHGKTIALFGTAGFGGDKSYFDRILSAVKSEISSDNNIVDGFMCQGRMPQAVRERYEKMLAKDPNNMQFTALINNFDSALMHPDDNDYRNAETWAKHILSENN